MNVGNLNNFIPGKFFYYEVKDQWEKMLNLNG